MRRAIVAGTTAALLAPLLGYAAGFGTEAWRLPSLSRSSVRAPVRLATSVNVTPESAPWVARAGTSGTRTFTVQNTGTVTSTYNITLTCDASAFASCSTTTSSVNLAANAYANITTNYTAGSSGPVSGRLTLKATLSTDAAVKDSGAFVFSVDPNIVVTPDGQNLGIAPDYEWTEVRFVVINNGVTSQTLNLTTTCTGYAIIDGCQSPGSVTLAGGSATTVSTQIASGDASTTGRVRLLASSTSWTDFSDTAWVNVTSTSSGVPATAVTPDGQTATIAANAASSRTFQIDNPSSSSSSASYTVSAVCTGTAIPSGCSVSPTSVTVTGSAVPVTVNFTSGGYLTTGRISVVAKLTSDTTVRDSGWVHITAASAPAATVTPDGANVTSAVSTSRSESFVVKNSGGSPGDFTLAATCTGGAVASGCTPSATSVSLAAGAQTSVSVSYTTGTYAQTGTVRLKSTWNGNAAVNDSGTWNVTTHAAPVIVATPDGQTSMVAPDTATSVTFSMSNTGGPAGNVSISANCTGALFSTGCTAWPTTSGINSGQTNIQVSFTPSGYGTTGRIRLLVKLNSDTTIRDTAWVDVTAKSAAISVTPDGTVANPDPGAATAVFTVTNTGNTGNNFTVLRTCFGQAFPSGCSTPSSPIWLNPGASTNITLNYTAGDRGKTGYARLWLVSSSYPAQSDTGQINVSVAAHPAVVVGQDAQSITVSPSQDLTQTFTVQNTGDAYDTMVLQAICTGEGFAVACATSADSVNLPPQGTAGIDVTYRSGEPLTSGRIALHAISRLDPAVRDSGWTTLSVNSTVSTVAVTPDGAVRSGITANASNQFVTFTLNATTGTYWLTATCTGAAITGGCIPQANPLFISPSGNVNILFNSGPAGSTGRITLLAKYGNDAAVNDVGSIDIRVGAPSGAAIAVAPDGQTETRLPPRTPRSVNFTLSNPGNSAVTLSLSAACTGTAVAAGCTLGTTSVSLNPNDAAMVPVSYTTGDESTTGRIRLLATTNSGAVLTDSGWVDLATLPRAPIAVQPRGENLTKLAGQGASVLFRLSNTGGLTTTYNVRAICSGQVFATACAGTGTSQVVLGAGTTTTWGVEFTAGMTGSTGKIRLIAEVNGDPALRDSGWVNVTATPVQGATVSVSADGAPEYIYPGASWSTGFNVINTGTASGTFTLAASCSGEAVGSTCSPSQSSITLGPGVSSPINVNYTAGAVATIGRVQLTATLTTNASVKDSGWMNVSTGSTGSTTVRVDPDAEPWSLAPNTAWMRAFAIQNTGTAAGTFNLTPVCTGGAIAAGCTLSSSSVALPAGASKYVTLSVTSGQSTGLTGQMKVTATLSTNTAVKDSGWYNVSTSNPKPAVTPDGQNAFALPASSGSVLFTVRNPTSNTEQYSLGVSCPATIIQSGCVLSRQLVVLSPGVSTDVSASFTTTNSGTDRIVLTASPLSGPVNSDTGWVNLTVHAVPTSAIAVTPKAGSQAGLAASAPASVAFAVSNPGTAPATDTLVATCSWGGAPISCSPSAHKITLGAGTSQQVSIGFNTGTSTTSGVIKLRATVLGSSPLVVDSGWVTATTGSISAAPVSVSVRSANPGSSVARNQCLTIAAGEGAAVECGDLRVVHALPATRTMNKERAPTLLYNSRHAKPGVVIAANVAIGAGLTPDSLQVNVVIPSKPTVTRSFPWQASWPAGTPRRIAVPIDAAQLVLPTGAYPYTFEVKAKSGQTILDVGSDTGTLVIVDRSLSPFGEGWWLDGLEQLTGIDATRKLWIGGDGSTRIYTKQGSTDTWLVTPAVDRPDTLIATTEGGQSVFRRRLRNRGYVEFNSAGQHTATVNSQQHRTSFFHSTVLDSIKLPGPTSLKYSFTYDTYASGQPRVLTSVTAPSLPGTPRTVNLDHQATWRVNRITDPRKAVDPEYSVRFRYDGSNRLTARLNQLNDSTSFSYDAAGHVAQVTVHMRSDPAIVTTLCVSESRSLASCATGPQRLDSTFTRLVGPRPNVATLFYVNRFGAPDTVVNMLGQRTRIRREDPTFPLLATAVVQPNGFETQALYNARGLPDLVTAVAPFGPQDSTNAVTRYFWNQTFDVADSIKGPTGEVTRFGYDVNGNREWQEDGRGVINRALFFYDLSNRVERIRPPGNSAAQEERIFYDTRLGNVERITSPLGSLTEYVTDWIGRDSVVRSPVDVAGSQRTIDRLAYDMVGRVTDQWTDAPAIALDFQYLGADPAGGSTAAMTRHVNTTYDAAGNPLSVLRRSLNTSGTEIHLASRATTTFTYDAAGRKLTEHNPGRFRGWKYDEAGNVTRDSSSHGVITMTYDSLNRLKTRTVPGRNLQRGINTFPDPILPGQEIYYPYFRRPFAGTGTFQDSLVIFDDVATFDYDANGNLTLADNNDARVRRRYFPNGLLKVDSLTLARYTFVAAPAAPVFDGGSYVQAYTYDLSGRRLSRQDYVPGCQGCTQQYHYDALSGMLDWTEDQGSVSGSPIRFMFGYDGAGRLENRWTNGTGASAKVHVNHGFDADGQLTSRTVTSNTAPTLTTVFQDHLTYDARGKIAHATIGSDLSSISSDEWEHLYDGFGALTAAGRNRGSGITADVNSLDALGNVITRVADSTLSSTPKHVDFSFAADKIFSAIRPAHVIPTDGGGPKDSTRFETYYYHDGNGNQIFEEHFVYEQRVIPTSGLGSFADLAAYGHTWQWMTYGRDNKLRYTQRSSHDVSGHRTVFTEYRYDALGRKVLARHRRDTLCTPTWEWRCHSSIERFLWDGDQLLGEVRFDGADHLSEGSLNTGAGTGPFYGTVRYTHAHGIDEPLAVWGGGSGLYGVVPHLSWRGGYEAGSNIETGALLDDGGTPAWIWPARYRDLNLAPDTRAPNPEPTRWLGSLIEGQVDLSGLAYRRNRYYNPATGRFTQEDPIGLAGGLNLYGFAEGDPVNLSDPFGLWPCCVEASAFSMASRALAFEALLQQSVNLALGVVGGMTRIEKVIRFSQRSISAVFRHGEFAGKKVKDVAAGVRSGEISPDRLPVNVVELLGERYSMNNRSLTALRLGGKEPSVVRDVTSDPAFMRQLMERLKELGTARTDALPRIRRRQ